MAKAQLSDISAKMKSLDICMMTTRAANGDLLSRPMSNNGDVEYDGNSYFFTYDKSALVKELEEDPQLNMSFNGKDGLYISVTGKAKLIEDKAAMQEHWLDELNKWFPDGVDTAGVIMIHVKASLLKFWHGEEQGEVEI